MKSVKCPHCKVQRLPRPRIHQDVVAVMPCPSCHGLAVIFRDVVIPLDRKIIENGNTDERAKHFAQVIAEFLESGIMPFQVGDGSSFPDMDEFDGEEELGAITEKEIERFVRIDLKGLDNSKYFKKHFGRRD